MFSETFMNNQYICFRNSHSSELRDWRPPIIGKNVIIFSNSVIGRPPMAPTDLLPLDINPPENKLK
jgi:hypothetical protein